MRILSLAIGLMLLHGCRTIPGRDVRFEPTPMTVVRAMLDLAGAGPQDIVYDLGAGDGRIPIAAASEFGARGVGIELDPVLVARAQANAREARVEDKVEFRLGDMYVADVRPATVVTLFLHPEPNLKLRPTLRADLRPGSRIVSYMWDMGDWTPDEVRLVGRHRIFLWRIPVQGGHLREGGRNDTTDWSHLAPQFPRRRDRGLRNPCSEINGDPSAGSPALTNDRDTAPRVAGSDSETVWQGGLLESRSAAQGDQSERQATRGSVCVQAGRGDRGPNLFQNSPVTDLEGHIEIREPNARPGDYMVLHALDKLSSWSPPAPSWAWSMEESRENC